MRNVLGYGLLLLAAFIPATRSALAGANDSASLAGNTAQFFMAAASSGFHAVPGYLGVDVRDIPADQVNALKLKESRGAEIILVDHDAPAGKVGLREHDVVLQMNGQVIDGQDQLRRLLRESPPGKTVQLVVSRDGQQITLTTQMASRDEVERKAWEQHLSVPEPQVTPSETADSSPAQSSSPTPRAGNSFIGTLIMAPSYTGAMLEKMSSQLAQFFGVSSGAGLLVRSVEPNSPASIAGMQAGDVVVRANSRSVTSTTEWAKAIKSSHGQPFSIVVLRDKKEQTLTLTPDGKKRSSIEPPRDPSPSAVARLGFSWMSGS
jgi:serine protease Do